ncbi:MAG: hypothetical protein K9J16_10910 [Melioribacteraceae bacterium]|nr:hypothetical protein [Melioribacteraceae bacterium]MCF8355518.1 hypothetical protein [Melioribacteraceae bacterium]MCF8394206.1 hypothetical protein [Melioribacteraceae bacterium]MCF8419926.1 hypothetical protein [Melioribacteraceae bacterium]
MSINKRYILIYVNYKIDFDFFSRFQSAVEKIDYKLFLISNKVSLKFYAKKKNIKLELIKSKYKINTRVDISRSVEFLNNWITESQGISLYNSVYSTAKSIINKFNIDYLFLLNGNNIHDIALKEISVNFKIKKIFFELSNIPGKIFIDPIGTNSQSSIFQSINLLDSYKLDENKYKLWLAKYKVAKENYCKVPQGIYRFKINNPLLLIDEIGFLLLRIPKNKNENYLRKLLEKIPSFKSNIFDSYDIERRRYVFLPLQLPSDTQLLINSKISNDEAICRASQIAKNMSVDLVVKLHPATISHDFIKEVMLLKQKIKFYLVDIRTIDLIKASEKIITINSTVGLESMIFNKEVEFLGESIYTDFNSSRLKKYICSYLVDIDYFSDKEIELEYLNDILQRV